MDFESNNPKNVIHSKLLDLRNALTPKWADRDALAPVYISIKDNEDLVFRTISVIDRVLQNDFSLLDSHELSRLGVVLDSLLSLRVDQQVTPHDPLVRQIIDELNNECFKILTLLSYLYSHGNRNLSVQLSEELETARTNANEIVKVKSNIDDLFKDAQAITSESLIENYSKVFAEEAKSFKYQSIAWLVATVACLVIILLISMHNYDFFEENIYLSGGEKNKTINNTMFIQFIISRLLIITCLVYGLSLAIRNYRWARHNQTVNKHRQNSLNTFRAYMNSFTPDEQTRNAILLEVARTIFGNQNTGFIDNSSDDSSSRIIEIFKPIIESK